MNVETIAGDLPCWRIGIRTGALPGKPHNAHVAVPAFLQFLANSAPLVQPPRLPSATWPHVLCFVSFRVLFLFLFC